MVFTSRTTLLFLASFPPSALALAFALCIHWAFENYFALLRDSLPLSVYPSYPPPLRFPASHPWSPYTPSYFLVTLIRGMIVRPYVIAAGLSFVLFVPTLSLPPCYLAGSV